MHDIVREAELAVMDGYLAEGIKIPHNEIEEEFLSYKKKLPKANHVDQDYLAIKQIQVTNFKRR